MMNGQEKKSGSAAGVLEDGVTDSDRGTGQGSAISPLLAPIYLRYGFDLWVERWRRRKAAGDMIIVRYPITRELIMRLADDWLPQAKILHPQPQ